MSRTIGTAAVALFALSAGLLLTACWNCKCGGACADCSGSTTPAPTATSFDALSDAGLGSDTGDSAMATTNSCAWPDSLNDSGLGGCHASRVLVSCIYPNGAGCGCTSNDAIECEGCGPATGASCHDQCATNEYAVECGGIGPPPPDAGAVDNEPPASCRFSGVIPAGITYYCCPCE